MPPVRVLLLGYFFYMFCGWVLLCLPMSQVTPQPALDHLFTAVSATSTTGLATLSTGQDYTFWGQLVILALIQLGGIGYMTLGSFVILSRSSVLNPLNKSVSSTAFSLPEGFRLERFIRHVIIFTLIVEALGALALFFILRPEGGLLAHSWNAVFHSVSAFCTAGFSLYGDSFMSYRGDVALNLVIGALSYCGAIGFIVLSEFWEVFTNRKKGLSLTSKIILQFTFWSSVIGTLFLFTIDQSMVGAPVEERLLSSWFQVMTSLTTVGFNTHDFALFSQASAFFIFLFMFVGASPSGTGGGLKSTTVTAMWGVMQSTLRQCENVVFKGKSIPVHRVRSAISATCFYGVTLIVGLLLLTLVEKQDFLNLSFEALSALGTVGTSRGSTGELTVLGKLIIIFMMFVGRLGPLTFGLAVFPQLSAEEGGEEDLAV